VKIVAPFLVIAVIVAVIFFLRSRRRAALVIISSPRFGILNLKGDAAASIIAEDTGALLPVLGQPQQSGSTAPVCDVLFLYCDMERDGRIRNWRGGLREIIRDTGATVVVVASENESDAYIAAGKDRGYGRANLVMTLQRRGNVFPSFIARLFADMKRGVSMPVAWVKLAPQVPGHEHPNCPGTIFSCEAGQVAFR
jgi:hypothetical protein